MRFTILIFALLSILTAFYFGQKIASQLDQDLISNSQDQPFQIPVIKNLIEADYPLFEEDAILPSEGLVLGKYPITDTIELTEEDLSHLDNETLNREEWEKYNSVGLQVHVDYDTTIPDSLVKHHNKDLLKKGSYFPIYLVNETHSTKAIYSQDDVNSVLIANIKSSYGYFPITMNTPNFCHYGKSKLRIDPGEMVVIVMPKFKGTIKASMFVRMSLLDGIISSQSFEGWMNPNQFYFDKNAPYHSEVTKDLKRDPVGFSNIYFTGISPKIYWDELD